MNAQELATSIYQRAGAAGETHGRGYASISLTARQADYLAGLYRREYGPNPDRTWSRQGDRLIAHGTLTTGEDYHAYEYRRGGGRLEVYLTNAAVDGEREARQRELNARLSDLMAAGRMGEAMDVARELASIAE